MADGSIVMVWDGNKKVEGHGERIQILIYAEEAAKSLSI
jgi:hypothetical protein